jgi:single-strand DNA-binding protein
MASLNKVFLIGNLTRDVELKFTPQGKAVGNVGLAVNRRWRDDQGQDHEEVTFIDLTLWGKTAETASKHLSKGSQVHVEGRLKMDEWEDKTTGAKRTKLTVVVDGLVFLGSPRGQGEQPRQRTAVDSAREAQRRQPEPPPYAEPEGDEEIPF